MSEVSLHQRLITTLVNDPVQAIPLAEAQIEAIRPVSHQLRAVVREGLASSRFLEGARAAVAAIDRYLDALQAVRTGADMRELTESYAFVIQAQQNLKEAHDEAVEALPLPTRPVPQNLVDLQSLVVGWQEGLILREDLVAACAGLIEVCNAAYTALGNADAIASEWDPEQVEELGNLMRRLEEGYLGAVETLENLQVIQRADDVKMVWPRLLASFHLLQATHLAISELEERMGPIEFLEDIRYRGW
jgi:hypothetical protein